MDAEARVVEEGVGKAVESMEAAATAVVEAEGADAVFRLPIPFRVLRRHCGL